MGKKFAAVMYALAKARGMLYKIKLGDEYEESELNEILDHTATDHLAKSLELKESDLAVDWDEFLSKEEIDKINGYR